MAAPNRGRPSRPHQNGAARNRDYPQQDPGVDDPAAQAAWNRYPNAAVQHYDSPQQQHQGPNVPYEAVNPQAENSRQQPFYDPQQQPPFYDPQQQQPPFYDPQQQQPPFYDPQQQQPPFYMQPGQYPYNGQPNANGASYAYSQNSANGTSSYAAPWNPSIPQQQSPSNQMSGSQISGANEQSLQGRFSELGLGDPQGSPQQTRGRRPDRRGRSQQSRPPGRGHNQAPITPPRGHIVQHQPTSAGQRRLVGPNLHQRNAPPRSSSMPSSSTRGSPSHSSPGHAASSSSANSSGPSTGRGWRSGSQRRNSQSNAATRSPGGANHVRSPGQSLMPSRDASLPSGSGTPLSKETEVTTLEVYANHFKLNLPKLDVHHYDVQIWSSAEGEEPPEDPRRIPACDKHRIFIRFAHLFLNIRAPVFDGQKSFYSTRPVEDKKEGVTVKSDFCSTTDFYVKIKRVARLNNERCGPGRGTVLVQALDIALRCALSRNRECLGRLLLSPVDEGRTSRDLAREGQALYRGVLTSVRSGEAGTFVNADTLHTVFYKPDSLLNLVQCLLGRPVQRQAKLQERDIQFLNAELKDLKVYVKHLPYRRTGKVEEIVMESADEKMIPSLNQTIAAYFNDKYRIRLLYPKLPCVKMQKKDCYYPLEMCFVPFGQQGVQKLAPVIPKTRFERAEAVVTEIEGKLLELDGFVTDISTSPVQITAKLLPTVSSWNPPQYSKKIRWIMLNTCNSDGARIRKLEQLENGLIGQGKAMGIELSKTNTLQRTGRQRVEDMLQEVKDRDVDFVVIVLENASSELYYPIKYYAETKLGLITQCVAIYKQNKEQNFGSGFCKNVMRKIKAKLGFVDKAMPSKINHFDFENVMVMGADVGHHGPNDAKPSVAAIVGSIDTCASRYVATISLQNEPRVEVIDDMGSMVRRLLDVYWQNNKAAPKAILFYRDGVSEGQYSQVYDRELPCLHAECKKAFPEYPIPKITFVTVQKRHRTRFMRKTPEGSNVPPGTVVDTVITHPSQQEFFMCSHTPMRGTARPAHYHVIRDDNEFDPETLQKITFSLCHMYARCETPVSIPTPVYYAHLTAARASCYLKAHERLTGMNTFNADVVKLTHNLKDRMFFI